MPREDAAGGRFTSKVFEAVGESVESLGAAMQGYRNLSVEVTGLSVRGPRVRGDEFLVVVKGLDEAGLPVVAFHSAMELGEALRGVEARISNGTLKWRADEFKA
jgi:hypothetical protein